MDPISPTGTFNLQVTAGEVFQASLVLLLMVADGLVLLWARTRYPYRIMTESMTEHAEYNLYYHLSCGCIDWCQTAFKGNCHVNVRAIHFYIDIAIYEHSRSNLVIGIYKVVKHSSISLIIAWLCDILLKEKKYFLFYQVIKWICLACTYDQYHNPLKLLNVK